NNRIARLKQAAELFILQIIEMGSWAGIVTFNSEATIKTGLQEIVFLQKYTSTEGCEIVLLTDGEDATVSSCFPQVQSSGSIIHTIAFGLEAAKELEKLADMTGK
ncbi:hypothetical protein JD844_017658, partial [Phrynosoma platyrhinos]